MAYNARRVLLLSIGCWQTGLEQSHGASVYLLSTAIGPNWVEVESLAQLRLRCLCFIHAPRWHSFGTSRQSSYSEQALVWEIETAHRKTPTDQRQLLEALEAYATQSVRAAVEDGFAS